MAFLLFFTAVVLSGIAAYYSVIGLIAIFSAAVMPVAIMGGSLEAAKLVVASWLYRYWKVIPFLMKAYFTTALVILMLITSMGIFGFLSKAHSDQSLVSGDVLSKLAIYDEKIKTAKENIEANRKQLKQMDEAVDQVMARSTSEQGADKSNAIRRSQQRDRVALAKDIEANQKLIATLNDEAAPIRAEVRKVEAEVGPIKYIAALVYDDNPDTNTLERAVRWVIILIVAVFDPLALVLILAAQQSLRWARDKQQEDQVIAEDTNDTKTSPPPANELSVEQAIESEVGTQQPEKSILEQHPYLLKPFAHFKNTKPMVSTVDDTVLMNINPEPPGVTTRNFTAEEIAALDTVQTVPMREVVEEYVDPNTRIRTLTHKLVPDDAAEPVGTGFGNELPSKATKGDLFVVTESKPTRLYKFNGRKWIEIDKSTTDSYTTDDYIKYLIHKIKTGEYVVDDLTDAEQESIREFLRA